MNCHADRSEAEWRDLLFSQSTSNTDGSAALPFVIPTCSEVEWGDLLFLSVNIQPWMGTHPTLLRPFPTTPSPLSTGTRLNDPPAIFTVRLFLSSDLLFAASFLADLPCSHHRPLGHIAGLLASVPHMAC